MVSSTCPLRYRHKGARVNLVPDFVRNIIKRARELGEGGGWIVSVAAWALSVEGGALVSTEGDPVFDA